jgi:hypothetical protein
MDCWIAGLLDCWIAGLLDCWIAGLLDCWIAGLLDCWIAGLLISINNFYQKSVLLFSDSAIKLCLVIAFCKA